PGASKETVLHSPSVHAIRKVSEYSSRCERLVGDVVDDSEIGQEAGAGALQDGSIEVRERNRPVVDLDTGILSLETGDQLAEGDDLSLRVEVVPPDELG